MNRSNCEERSCHDPSAALGERRFATVERGTSIDILCLNLEQVDARWVVGAEVVIGVGSNGNVFGRAANGGKWLEVFFSALTFDDLPSSVILGNRIGGEYQAVIFPGVLGLVAGPAFVASSQRVGDGDAEFVLDDGAGVEVRDEGAAIVGVEFVGIVDDAIHILHG